MQTRNKKIQIGIFSTDTAWNLLLRQIGIAFQEIVETDDLSSEYSVIIVNGNETDNRTGKIDRYLKNGGTVLYTVRATDIFRQLVTVKKSLTSLPPAKTTLYEFAGILDVDGDSTMFRNGDFVHAEPHGEGHRYFFGLDLDSFFANDTRRRNFHTDTERMPNEIVAARSKGVLRQLVFSLLRNMHHQQGLPFIHQWYFPGSARSIFTFRIDSDKGTQEQINEIRTLSERYYIPTTWFLDVKSHEHWLSYFRSINGQELGLHCYEHILHTSSSLNTDNFRKALSLLKQAGIVPFGITAPTGGWHRGYAESIRELGFKYSSEFSYDYDDLPTYPSVDGEIFPVLQLPIHPVCIGTMLRARMNDSQMEEYFRTQIDKNLILGEPICFYQHPTHGHNSVFEEVFKYINTLALPKLSYSEYADWWIQRDRSRTVIHLSEGTIRSEHGISNVHYRIILPDGRECITELTKQLTMTDLLFAARSRMIPRHDDELRSRRFDIRHWLQNALDWWITTTA